MVYLIEGIRPKSLYYGAMWLGVLNSSFLYNRPELSWYEHDNEYNSCVLNWYMRDKINWKVTLIGEL